MNPTLQERFRVELIGELWQQLKHVPTSEVTAAVDRAMKMAAATVGAPLPELASLHATPTGPSGCLNCADPACADGCKEDPAVQAYNRGAEQMRGACAAVARRHADDGVKGQWTREDVEVQSGRAEAATDIEREILALPTASAQQPVLGFTYTNYRGETSDRRVRVLGLRHGSTEWHPEPQWLLRAWDLDKQAEREFALRDMRPVGAAQATFDTRDVLDFIDMVLSNMEDAANAAEDRQLETMHEYLAVVAIRARQLRKTLVALPSPPSQHQPTGEA